MKRDILVSKHNIFWAFELRHLRFYLLMWGAYAAVLIISAAAYGKLLLPIFIMGGSLLTLFLLLAGLGSLSMLSGFACIKRQEDWFSINFNLEMKDKIMHNNLYVGQTWYVCLDENAYSSVFRKGYITEIIGIEPGLARTPTIVTVKTIDNRIQKLRFTRGNEDKIKALKEFVQGDRQ